MIVIGTDPHKRTHTLVAVDVATGEQLGCETVKATAAGSQQGLSWARALDRERVWAIEDCRHVSGRLERAPVARGEQVVRVAPKLMAGARRGSRERGKSDPIDALALAPARPLDDFEIPAGALDRAVWFDRVARRLASCEQTARVRIAREQVRSIRARTRRVRELEAELAAPQPDHPDPASSPNPALALT
jgi:transposase